MTTFNFLWPYKQKNHIYFLVYLEISGPLDKKNILIAYENNNPQIFMAPIPWARRHYISYSVC